MIHNIWKFFFILIAFIGTINSSHESSNHVTNDLKKLAISNNNLGLNLYQTLAKNSSGNVFISPFSLSTAMAMVFEGASGNTAEELRTVLGYEAADLPNEDVSSSFNAHMNKVLSKNQLQESDYVLNLANELLISNSFEVSPNYTTEVQDQFHANIKKVNFGENSAQILNEVNDWVKEQTHGKIDKLINDLQPSTVLLILNAIYFKGTWKYLFDQKLTKQQKFYNNGLDSKAKEVPLMHMTARLPFASVDDMQALEFPYKGDDISMIILLPKERNGLKRLEDSITVDRFLDIQKQMHLTEVIITLPKFKVEYRKEVVPDFKKMGAKDIFIPGVADLSGISPKRIHVSEIIHKAAIEVNEEGSEAAAATAVLAVLFSASSATLPPPPEFTADHPFMYAIVDKRNDLILFLGRVSEL